MEILEFSPDIVVLQKGGNDLDNKPFDVRKVVSFINILQQTDGVKKVVVCEIFGRRRLALPTHVYHYGKQYIDHNFESIDISKQLKKVRVGEEVMFGEEVVVGEEVVSNN
ncbi:Hypothetical predicted protein [Mytilus galloprovincialis]|uniref:Uncharacterized protein n=1 Tax=Mytilus galloprovincialis TaxID=29158 RepID=A0A8B6BMM5_MYTGA|nr:Hypothetical predicted protein [Mytilus galloprovincialis]